MSKWPLRQCTIMRLCHYLEQKTEVTPIIRNSTKKVLLIRGQVINKYTVLLIKNFRNTNAFRQSKRDSCRRVMIQWCYKEGD